MPCAAQPLVAPKVARAASPVKGPRLDEALPVIDTFVLEKGGMEVTKMGSQSALNGAEHITPLSCLVGGEDGSRGESGDGV